MVDLSVLSYHYCRDYDEAMPNRLDPKVAEARMIKAGCHPLTPYVNAISKWKCKCIECGLIIYPRLNNVTMGKTPCSHVPVGEDGIPTYGLGANHISQRNKYKNQDAIQIMLDAGVKPIENYSWRKQKWKCECMTCGEIITPTLQNVLQGHNPCRNCARSGINIKTSSYLYLITNPQLNAHKVGIGNNKKNRDRLKNFNKAGWQTFKVWQFKTGRIALKVESEVFKVVRKELKMPIYLNKDQMSKLLGHSETINADSITLLELEKIIKKVIRSGKVKS